MRFRALIIFIMLTSCAEVSGVIQASRSFCDGISKTKQQYIECMDRETRFLKQQ